MKTPKQPASGSRLGTVKKGQDGKMYKVAKTWQLVKKRSACSGGAKAQRVMGDAPVVFFRRDIYGNRSHVMMQANVPPEILTAIEQRTPFEMDDAAITHVSPNTKRQLGFGDYPLEPGAKLWKVRPRSSFDQNQNRTYYFWTIKTDNPQIPRVSALITKGTIEDFGYGSLSHWRRANGG